MKAGTVHTIMAAADWAALVLIVLAGFAGAPWWVVMLAVAWWLKLESGTRRLT